MAKTLTDLQRFRKNLNRRIKSMQKRGYFFEPEYLDGISTLSISDLQREYSGNALYQKSVWISPKTHEIIQGTTRLQMERREAARKGTVTRANKKLKKETELPDETSIIITNLMLLIEETEVATSGTLIRIVSNAITEIGRKAFALNVRENWEELTSQIKKIKYMRTRNIYSGEYDNAVNTAITRIARTLVGRPLTSSELFKYAEAERLSAAEQALQER